MAENSATNGCDANSYNDEAVEEDEGDLSWSETDVSLEGTWTDEESEPRERLADGGSDVEEEMTTDERGRGGGGGKERTEAVKKEKEEKFEKDARKKLEKEAAPNFDRKLAKITFSRRSASSVSTRVDRRVQNQICIRAQCCLQNSAKKTCLFRDLE